MKNTNLTSQKQKNWPVRFFIWLKTKLNPEKKQPKIERKKVDSEQIRCRIKAQGWILSERPIRSQQTITRWQVIAIKGEKSLETGGKTIDEAIKNIGEVLGVIAREK